MRTFAAAIIFAAAPASAFEMISPVDCTLGETCFIQQYTDLDTGPEARDPFCGPRSYDGHQGTDFRLPDLAAMREGVAVVAAAPGTVRATRDGMPDVAFGTPDAPDLNGKDCGNGVLIVHEQGWSTQYCHLRKGSIAVKDGDQVAAGAVLGLIGLSGRTQFPHLHLTVRRQDDVIDPFIAEPMDSTCRADQQDAAPLWSAESGVTFQPGGVLSVGILPRLPGYEEIQATSPHEPELDPFSDALVVWGHFFGIEQADRLNLILTDPTGQVIAEESYEMPRNRAVQFRAVGRKRSGAEWPQGTYTGQINLLRGGEVIDQRRIETAIR
ncbi:MAG: M23 family metallopeptidase [Pseudomonadota bacterium]